MSSIRTGVKVLTEDDDQIKFTKFEVTYNEREESILINDDDQEVRMFVGYMIEVLVEKLKISYRTECNKFGIHINDGSGDEGSIFLSE